jgi:hypothetical protein
MAAKLPLYVPVTISERRAYTATIYLCDTSAQLDTANVYAVMRPVFDRTDFATAFASPSAMKPTELWFSPGDILYYRAFTRSHQKQTGTSNLSDLPSGTYDVLMQRSAINMPWTYANNALTITFNVGLSFPTSWEAGDQFALSYVPVQYLWSCGLLYSDGSNVRFVDESPVTIDIMRAKDPTPPPQLTICSAKVA